MVRSRRLEIAEVEADRLRKRLGRNLVGIGVFGSVGRGDDRTGSDIDLVVVTQSQVKIKSRVVSGIPVTFLPLTPEGAREEVYGSRKDLNVALGGWRSLKPLYDPTKFLARLRQRAFHPRPLQFRRASQKALLETFEDLGKLRNAIEAKDRDEMREMAIWFTDGAMGALFDLERFVLATGRRAFVEARRFGRTGEAIRRLRYDDRSPAEASSLAEAIWSDLIARANRQGIRLPELLLKRPRDVRPPGSRLAVAERFVRGVQRREGSNLIAAGLYGSVAAGEDRKHSDIDLLLMFRVRREYPRIIVFGGSLVSISPRDPTEVRGEIEHAWNRPESLSGWRSMRILHDPSGLLRRSVAWSRRPSEGAFNRAVVKNLLEGYEYLGKLGKAARANDPEETREMAIWFSASAMFAVLCLERHVVETGRRLFAELRDVGPLGRAICRLRYESQGVADTAELATRIWSSLLARARQEGLPLPRGLIRAPGTSLDGS